VKKSLEILSKLESLGSDITSIIPGFSGVLSIFLRIAGLGKVISRLFQD